MAEYYPTRINLKQGIEYIQKSNLVYIFDKIGTDGSTDTTLVVDGKETGEIIDVVAPLHKTETNLLGPIDLKELKYVIAPEVSFEVEGPTDTNLICEGQAVLLEPGEAVPGDLMDRFRAQQRHYLKYVQGTYSHGTDVAWGDGTEIEIFSITPKTIETITFNNVVMIDIANVTIAQGDWSLNPYLNNVPRPRRLAEKMEQRFDVLSVPHPPADTTEERPLSFEELPFEVPGDNTGSWRLKNVSGADISPASGTSIDVTLTGIVEYIRKA